MISRIIVIPKYVVLWDSDPHYIDAVQAIVTIGVFTEGSQTTHYIFEIESEGRFNGGSLCDT